MRSVHNVEPLLLDIDELEDGFGISDWRFLPELRQRAAREPGNDELGLRLLFDLPEPASRRLWRKATAA